MDGVIYLNVPFAEKDTVKKMGAKWDWNAKRWFVCDSERIKARFAKWLPAKGVTYADLSDEQKAVIDKAKLGVNILVDACIGSGKTTTIQTLCNELKDKNILYLTFNRLLKLDAQAKIVSPNTYVTNYDGFAAKCLHDANIQGDLERNIRLFNEHKPATPTYDLLIMDEYQDIREDIADMLITIKERNPNMQIIAVGDMEQKIFNFTALDIQGFMSEFLGEHESLGFTKCFRLSKDHAEKLGDLWGKHIEGVNTDSKTVIMHSLEDIVKFLADKDPKDILVLGSRAGDVARVLNALEDACSDKFNKSTVYASIKDADDGYAKDRNNVAIFTTFDSSKGLERKYCVVLDWTAEYYMMRKDKPDAQYTILKNLFLVAASRGKAMNVFYDKPPVNDHDRSARNLLSNLYYGVKDSDIPQVSRFEDGELLKTPFTKAYKHEDAFAVSSMYDFLYAEDVAACAKLIVETPIKREISEIEVEMHDENIDLSMCVGTLVEANYFKHYDLRRERKILLESMEQKFVMPREVLEERDGKMVYRYIRWDDKSATIEDKILMLAGTQTQQARYCRQVDTPFVSESDKRLIKERLATELDEYANVQTYLEIDFPYMNEVHRIHGICDAVKGDTIYELKFTSALRETHKLQLAMYLCMYPDMRGVLWNVRTNEMIEISVPDKKAFLRETVRAISKRNMTADRFFRYEPDHTNLSWYKGCGWDAVDYMHEM